MMFRRNVIRHIRHANAVWFDSGNVNCRLTRNIFADTLTVGAAVHMEMNRGQNQLDNNIVWMCAMPSRKHLDREDARDRASSITRPTS